MTKILYDIYNDDNSAFRVVANISRWGGFITADESRYGTWYCRTAGAIKFNKGSTYMRFNQYNLNDIYFYGVDTKNGYGLCLRGGLDGTGIFQDEGEGELVTGWCNNFKTTDFPITRIEWVYVGSV